jgi:hypothetical protein
MNLKKKYINRKGNVLIIFLFFLLLLSAFSISTRALLKEASEWIKIQTELDSCAYRKGSFSTNTLNKLGKLNAALKYLLIAKKAGTLMIFLPPAIGINAKIAIDRAIDLVVRTQDLLILSHDKVSYFKPLECLKFNRSIKNFYISEHIKRKSGPKSVLAWKNQAIPQIIIKQIRKGSPIKSGVQIIKNGNTLLTSGQVHEFSI